MSAALLEKSTTTVTLKIPSEIKRGLKGVICTLLFFKIPEPILSPDLILMDSIPESSIVPIVLKVMDFIFIPAP